MLIAISEAHMPSMTRWTNLWRELGATQCDPRLFEELIARYREPHRRYHTVQHLEECLAQLDGAHTSAEHASEAELALGFHDAIYDTTRQDNEERSADWARDSSLAAGVSGAAAQRVRELVMSTRHAALPAGADAQLLVDVDLSILGASAERFDEYERQIREEHAWVPDLLFRSERQRILEEFLARPSIFSTRTFRDRLESQARTNLARSIAALTNASSPTCNPDRGASRAGLRPGALHRLARKRAGAASRAGDRRCDLGTDRSGSDRHLGGAALRDYPETDFTDRRLRPATVVSRFDGLRGLRPLRS